MTFALSQDTGVFVDDTYWLREAYLNALLSDDPVTQLGAVIVKDRKAIMNGCNHFPKGVRLTAERLERPKKYEFMEHAERNVIFNCARWGKSALGCTLYAPWYACADCARAIIAAGIRKVVGHKQLFDKTPKRWKASIETGNIMLKKLVLFVSRLMPTLYGF
jgi:dCMP deaminase